MSDSVRESEKPGRASAPPKLPLRENAMAEGPLEIRQVYKLLQLVNQKNKEQVEKMVCLGVPGLINLTEPEEGKSALHLACLDNDLEMACFLLSLRAHPDIQDKQGRTATMLAAELGYVDTVKLLAGHHASMTLVDKEGVLFYCVSPTLMHEQIMEMALGMNADVNNVSHAGKSAFMFACERAEECEHLCMRLLEEGADPEVADPATGCTPLIAAVKAGAVALVRAILRKGVNPNAVDRSQLNAVHVAATKGSFEVLRMLSAHSADFNLRSALRNTALHAAAAEGHAECCRLLFQRGCDITKNLQDLLPSLIAKKNGHKAALKELKSAEQLWKDGAATFYPEARLHDWSFEHEAELRQAFEADETEDSPADAVPNETFVAVLQEHHAPVDQERLERVAAALDKDRWGKVSVSEFLAGCHYLPTNYQLSSYKSSSLKTESKSRPVREELPKEQAPPDSHDRPQAERADSDEDALLMFEPREMNVNLDRCVKSDDFKTLTLAFSQKVHVDSRDRVYKTPLMMACVKGKHPMAEFLLSYKANVNLHDQFKWTALHHACMEGHGEIAGLLVEHGALIDAATTNGVTPLMRAIQSCRFQCVDRLLNAGADVEATNKRGQDCLTLAKMYAAVEIGHAVEMALERAKLKKAAKKQAPSKAKKPGSTAPAGAQGRRVIALNPDASDHCITLLSATVCGPRVVPSLQLKKRLADRKTRLSKEDLMETTIHKPVAKTKGKAPKPPNPEADTTPVMAETDPSQSAPNDDLDIPQA